MMKNYKLISISIAALACASAFAVDQTVHGRFDGTSDDATYFNIAVTSCILTGGGTVKVPAPPVGKNYHFKTVAYFAGSPLFTVNIDATALDWQSIRIEHSGPAFQWLGMKGCKVEGLQMLLHKSDSIGIDFAGDLQHQSDSQNTFIRCRVQPLDNTVKNCTGYRIGNTGNDHSFYVFEQCDFLGAGNNSLQDVQGSVNVAHSLGHRGYEILGGNTLVIRINNSGISGCDVAISNQGRVGENPLNGGSGTIVDGGGGSFNALCYLWDGGLWGRFVGQRWENSGAFFCHGARLNGGRGQGRLTFEDIMCDGFRTAGNTAIGYIDSGSLIGLYSNGYIKMSNFGGYGNDTTSAKWMSIRSNLLPGPTLDLFGCFTLNTTTTPYTLVPFTTDLLVPTEGQINKPSTTGAKVGG